MFFGGDEMGAYVDLYLDNGGESFTSIVLIGENGPSKSKQL